jgi:putative oxidoreductase
VINGGWEYTVVLATVGASIALTGPGDASIDHALGLERSTAWGIGGVALGVAAALATLLLRRPGRESEPLGATA